MLIKRILEIINPERHRVIITFVCLVKKGSDERKTIFSIFFLKSNYFFKSLTIIHIQMISVALTTAVPAKGQNIVKNKLCFQSFKKNKNQWIQWNQWNQLPVFPFKSLCTALFCNASQPLYYIVTMQVPLLTPKIHRCLCVAASALHVAASWGSDRERISDCTILLCSVLHKS